MWVVRQVGPLESECAQLQDSLSGAITASPLLHADLGHTGELSAHVQTRQELAALKKRWLRSLLAGYRAVTQVPLRVSSMESAA